MKWKTWLSIVLSLSFCFLVTDGYADKGSEYFVTPLIASQHYTAGYVVVTNDADFLYVTYFIDIAYVRLFETNLHVATSPEGIPQKNGNPIPGQFDYTTMHDRWVQLYTYEIPMDPDWTPGTDLYIAAHATITGSCGQFATAWGDGFEFPGKNWALGFVYTVPE